jgi:alginate O-acetyltransferase complex protein AlgI
MLFNSVQFLFFFVIVTIIYFQIPYKFRWIHLLLASCYFYMVFFPVYILILGFTIVIDYFAGIFLEKLQGKNRKIFLIASLIANIGVLAVFKYYNFLNQNLGELLGIFGHQSPMPVLKILLPIGLSFHTFQAMSYTIEVYRNHVKAERNFGLYALYVMFYPQLVAGPIERPQNLLPQLHSKHDFNFEEFKAGLMQMAFGFLKKVVIADRLALVVDDIYGNVSMQNGSTLVVATFFYAFQIYCDFSGYSDIAIGAARIMGIKLMTNFNAPYFSKSISEFWKRWHISLSTWFKDYLYISLGGNRVSIPRWYFNLLIVFLISGLWHGANWTFIVWGGLHGFYMLSGIWKNKLLKLLKIRESRSFLMKILNISATFMLVCFAWIFFRATNFAHALQIIRKIGHISFHDKLNFTLNSTEMWFCVLLIVLLSLKERYYLRIQTRNTAWFFVLISMIAFGSYLFGVFNNKQFIYFQF